MGTAQSSDFDPYCILGVDRDATPKEINKAYKDKAILYHPDRPGNRGDKDKAKYFKMVCTSYEVLSDPTKRQQYNTNYSATHMNMKKGSKSTVKQQKQNKVNINKDNFNVNKFNAEFEKNRAKDPNDIGYGDNMQPHLTKDQISADGSMRRDDVDAPKRLFNDKAFNREEFNKVFEYQKQQEDGGLVERHEGEPMAFALNSGTAYTDIAVYNGAMIIGHDTDDFSSIDNNNGLDYTDYQRGYSGAYNPSFNKKKLGKISREQQYTEDTAMSPDELKRKYNERMAGMDLDLGISEGDRKQNFFLEEQKYMKQKELEMEQEQNKHKDIVFKYKDQFPQHLLNDLQISHPNGQQQQQGQQQYVDYYPQQSQQQNRTYEDMMRERGMY